MIERAVSQRTIRGLALGVLETRPGLSGRLVEVTGDVRPWWSLAAPIAWQRTRNGAERHAHH